MSNFIKYSLLGISLLACTILPSVVHGQEIPDFRVTQILENGLPEFHVTYQEDQIIEISVNGSEFYQLSEENSCEQPYWSNSVDYFGKTVFLDGFIDAKQGENSVVLRWGDNIEEISFHYNYPVRKISNVLAVGDLTDNIINYVLNANQQLPEHICYILASDSGGYWREKTRTIAMPLDQNNSRTEILAYHESYHALCDYIQDQLNTFEEDLTDLLVEARRVSPLLEFKGTIDHDEARKLFPDLEVKNDIASEGSLIEMTSLILDGALPEDLIGSYIVSNLTYSALGSKNITLTPYSLTYAPLWLELEGVDSYTACEQTFLFGIGSGVFDDEFIQEIIESTSVDENYLPFRRLSAIGVFWEHYYESKLGHSFDNFEEYFASMLTVTHLYGQELVERLELLDEANQDVAVRSLLFVDDVIVQVIGSNQYYDPVVLEYLEQFR